MRRVHALCCALPSAFSLCTSLGFAIPPAEAMQRGIGATIGDPRFDPGVDLNGDGAINACDVALLLGTQQHEGGLADIATLSFESTDIYPAAGESPRLKIFVSNCVVPLFGYSAAVRVVPLLGATGSVSAIAAQSTFFPPRHLILAAPGQPPLDPLFSQILPMSQGGVFINANTEDGSLVQSVDGVNDALGEIAFGVTAGTRGIFLIEFGTATTLSGAGGQAVPFDPIHAQISVGPRLEIAAFSTPSSVAPGSTLIVRIQASQPLTSLAAADLALRFDSTRIQLESVQPAEGGPFAVELLEAIDNQAGTLRYRLERTSGAPYMTAASPIAELRFRVSRTGTDCAATGLLTFDPVDAVTTSLTSAASTEIAPVFANLGPVTIDGTAPVLSGVPSSTTVPADAGTTEGGYVAVPSVTAMDGCDGAVSVSTSVAYPNGTTGTSWPSGGMFPVGTSVVTFSASDAAGNLASASCSVTVLNHQLLDATLSFGSAILGTASRTLRVKAGALVQVLPFTMANGAATIAGIQVPVAAGYACVSAKDTGFAVNSSASPSVSSRRYVANFAIVQGDSDDDDLIDIADFAYFFADRSTAGNPWRPSDARSNFNADSLVNNADFAYIAIGFFRVGETCTPGVGAPPAPRDRIQVKELRRSGLGELAAADLNRDGWVDMRDIQMFMQGGGAQNSPRPDAEQGVQW